MFRSGASLLGFVGSLVLAHLLGAAGYGAYAWALAWASIFQVAAALGFDKLIIREVAVYRTRSEWGLLRGLLRRSDQVALAASACLAAPVVVGGLWMLGPNDLRFTPLLAGLALSPLLALALLRESALQGFQRIVAARLPQDLIRPALFLILLMVGWHVWGNDLTPTMALTLNFLAVLVAFVGGSILLRGAIPSSAAGVDPIYDTRTWARSARHMLLVGGTLVVLTQTDIVIVGAIKGPEAAGIYGVAMRGAILIQLILLAVNIAIAPIVAQLYAQGELVQMQSIATRSARLALLGSGAAGLVLGVFGGSFLAMFGSEFERGHGALAILVAAFVVNAAAGSNSILLLMTGHEQEASRGFAVGAVSNVVLNACLIPLFGFLGAAAAYFSSVVIWNGILTVSAWRKLGIDSTVLGRPSARIVDNP